MTWQELVNLPIDSCDGIDFYKNVIRQVTPTLVEMECNGIPLDASRTESLGGRVRRAKDIAKDSINSNPLMVEYLKKKHNAKTESDFLETFNPKSKVHVSYAINALLLSHSLGDLCLSSTWNDSDIDMLRSLVPEEVLEELEHIEITPYPRMGMLQLARDKAEIWNKQNFKRFNPNSPKQIKDFLSYCGYDLDSTDRNSLIELRTQLEHLL